MIIKNQKIKSLLSVLVLTLIIIFFYRDQIFGSLYIPFDSKSQVYPFVAFTSQTYRSGSVPLWNPFIYSGTPSFADPLYMTFYPGILLYMIPEFLSQRYFDLIELMHILVGGISVYFLLKNYKVNNFAAIGAAIVFMLGGPLTGRIQHVTQISAVSLFPLILLLIRFGIQKQKLWIFGLAGIILGSTIMIGYQPAFLFFIVAFFYFVVEFFSYGNHEWKSVKILFLQMAFMFFVAFCFSAIQTIPTLEFARLSNRPEYDYVAASDRSITPSILFTLVFPNLFNSISGEFWGPFDIAEGYLYIGLIPIFFVFYSIINWKRINHQNRFFIITSFLSIFYALGKFTPLYYIFYTIIPPVRLFRRPSDAYFIFQLCISISLGFGIDFWIGKIDAFKKQIVQLLLFLMASIILFILAENIVSRSMPEINVKDWYFLPNLLFLAIFLVLVGLKNKISIEYCLVAIIICMVMDITITSNNRPFNSITFDKININSEEIYGCPTVVKLLQNNVGDQYRFETVHAGNMWTNAAAIWKISSTVGYSPLVVGSYNEFASPTQSYRQKKFDGMIQSYSSQLYNLLGVKYIISSLKLDEIDPGIDLSNYSKLKTPCFNVYENKNPLPLAFVVHKARILNNETESYSQVAEDYDPANIVVLEKIPNAIESNITENNGEIIFGKNNSLDNVSIKKKGNNYFSVLVTTKDDGILVLNDVYYPGWKVFIDGKPADLLKTNFTFKGVYVSSGTHFVEFKFLPTSFFIGLSFSIISVFIVILSFLWKGHKK